MINFELVRMIFNGLINLLKQYQVFAYGFPFGNYTTILCVLHRELKYCYNVNDKGKCLKKKTLKAKQQKQNSNKITKQKYNNTWR